MLRFVKALKLLYSKMNIPKQQTHLKSVIIIINTNYVDLHTQINLYYFSFITVVSNVLLIIPATNLNQVEIYLICYYSNSLFFQFNLFL